MQEIINENKNADLIAFKNEIQINTINCRDLDRNISPIYFMLLFGGYLSALFYSEMGFISITLICILLAIIGFWGIPMILSLIKQYQIQKYIEKHRDNDIASIIEEILY